MKKDFLGQPLVTLTDDTNAEEQFEYKILIWDRVNKIEIVDSYGKTSNKAKLLHEIREAEDNLASYVNHYDRT